VIGQHDPIGLGADAPQLREEEYLSLAHHVLRILPLMASASEFEVALTTFLKEYYGLGLSAASRSMC